MALNLAERFVSGQEHVAGKDDQLQGKLVPRMIKLQADIYHQLAGILAGRPEQRVQASLYHKLAVTHLKAYTPAYLALPIYYDYRIAQLTNLAALNPAKALLEAIDLQAALWAVI